MTVRKTFKKTIIDGIPFDLKTTSFNLDVSADSFDITAFGDVVKKSIKLKGYRGSVVLETGTVIDFNHAQYVEIIDDTIYLYGILKQNKPYDWQIEYIKRHREYKNNSEFKYDNNDPYFETPQAQAFINIYDDLLDLNRKNIELHAKIERLTGCSDWRDDSEDEE